MPSPAQLHKMRALATRATATAVPGSAVGRHTSDAHRLIRAKLDTDRRQLKAIHSIKAKIELKRKLLPDYAPYISGVIAAGVGVQDEVLAYIMLWCFDVGDFAAALPIARYVLEHQVTLPEGHKRTAATAVAEEAAIAALGAAREQRTFDVRILREAWTITRKHDMPDQVRAKLLFAAGRQLKDERPKLALILLRAAVGYHEAVGAKKDIERLEARVRRESIPAGDAGTTEQPSNDGA